MQEIVIYNSPSFLHKKPHYLRLNPILMTAKLRKIVQLLLTESIPDIEVSCPARSGNQQVLQLTSSCVSMAHLDFLGFTSNSSL